MSVEAEWIDDAGEWSAYRDVWDDVVARSTNPSVFLTWDYVESSWLHLHKPAGSGLAVLALREGGRVIGLAPLFLSTRRRFGLPVRQLASLSKWTSDYHSPLILPAGRERACVEALLSLLERRRREWDLLTVDGAPEEPVLDAMRGWAASRAGFSLVETELPPSPYVPLDGGDPLGGLSRSTRKTLRRLRRQAEAERALTLEVFEEAQQMDSAIDRYLEIEDRSWKRGMRHGVGARRRDFFRDLLPRLAAKKRALLFFLKLGEQPVAARINFRMGPTAHGCQTVYDRAFAQHSPGNLLLGMVLAWHAEHGIRRYELWARFLENKQHFTKHARKNARLAMVQVNGLRRAALFLPGMTKRALARRAMRSRSSRPLCRP